VQLHKSKYKYCKQIWSTASQQAFSHTH